MVVRNGRLYNIPREYNLYFDCPVGRGEKCEYFQAFMGGETRKERERGIKKVHGTQGRIMKDVVEAILRKGTKNLNIPFELGFGDHGGFEKELKDGFEGVGYETEFHKVSDFSFTLELRRTGKIKERALEKFFKGMENFFRKSG